MFDRILLPCGEKSSFAGVAQPVEQLTCNQQVGGSIPFASSSNLNILFCGGLPEWLKGTGCKPVGESLRWFKSIAHHQFDINHGNSFIIYSLCAGVAQLVERQPSKLRVAGSNPVSRSKDMPT